MSSTRTDRDSGALADPATDASQRPSNPVVLLLGPTASGKSAAALALARRFPIEIISVDSACVYRGLNIGTAKPSAEELRAVRHHLVDCVEPWDPYSAARFVLDARAAIAAARSRGARPVLVGGTMLYARALMVGLDDLPAADATVRARLESEAAQLGWPALHARLAALDSATAERLAPRDAQRIQRALEVIELTGRPLSTQLRGSPQTPDQQLWRIISLEPGDRAVLHKRIEARFRHMIGQGLVAEVEQLRADPRVHSALASMKSVGYRQVWDVLEGRCPPDELEYRAIVATRQLAKRQLTWLRSMPERVVVDCTRSEYGHALDDALARALESARKAS